MIGKSLSGLMCYNQIIRFGCNVSNLKEILQGEEDLLVGEETLKNSGTWEVLDLAIVTVDIEDTNNQEDPANEDKGRDPPRKSGLLAIEEVTDDTDELGKRTNN